MSTATATAAVARSAGQAFGIERIQLDDPRPHEVLVELEAVGICHTDLSVRAGHTPFPLPGVLGHEGVGTVAAVGDAVTATTRGERVLLSFDSCGACRACRELRPVQCLHWQALNLFGGRRLDGSPVLWDDAGRSLHGKFFGQSSFATLALASDRNVVPVPKGLPAEALAPFGCGVQTGAGAVLNVLRPEPGHTLAVFGAGGVGLAAVMAARLTAATRIIAVDLHPARLELARELGATDIVDAHEQDAVAAIEDLTDGHGADRALEASGASRRCGRRSPRWPSAACSAWPAHRRRAPSSGSTSRSCWTGLRGSSASTRAPACRSGSCPPSWSCSAPADCRSTSWSAAIPSSRSTGPPRTRCPERSSNPCCR